MNPSPEPATAAAGMPGRQQSRLGAAGKWAIAMAAVYAVGLGALMFALSRGAGGDSPWVPFLGRFHFVLLHLPIGILTAAFGIELVALFSRAVRPARAAVTPALWFAALAGVGTTACGVMLSSTGGYAEDLLRNHQWLGIGVVAATIVTLVLKSAYDARGRVPAALGYRFALAVTVGLVMVAGHFGGYLTHGRGFLTRDLPPELAPLAVRLGVIDGEGAGGGRPVSGGATEAPGAAEASFYASHIQPVFEAKCWECHGDSKQKGDYRMDSVEALLAGGDTGPAVEPGDAEASELFYRLVTDDEDERMPPDDKNPMSEAELTLIRWWIEVGAPTDQSLEELSPGEEVRAAAESVVQPAPVTKTRPDPNRA